VSRVTRDTAVLTDLAGALRVPCAALGLVGDPDQRPILDDVERREFLGGAAGLAVTALLPQSVATPGASMPPRQPSAGQRYAASKS
jgi:hypothetical protein